MSSKHGKASRHSQMPAWLWLSLGIFLGVAIALFGGFNNSVFDKTSQPHHQNQKSVKPEKEVPRKYDFYTLLPELEIVIPDERVAPARNNNNTNSAPPTTSSVQGAYMLQAGSFGSVNEADSLKARLALLGVKADIQTVKVNAGTWHRVRVGPYQDLNKVNEIRKTLRSNGIETLLMQARE